MDLRPNKKLNEMSSDERSAFLWERRFVVTNPVLYAIYASGLAPAYRHMTGPGESFALISAEKGTFEDLEQLPEGDREIETRRRNRERTTDLRTRIRNLGYGYIQAAGVYKNLDSKVFPENTVFVPGITRDLAVALGSAFNQESVLWGNGDSYWMIYIDSGEQKGPFSSSESFHHIPEGDPIPPGSGETALRDKPTQRFTLQDIPVDVPAKTASIKIASGQRPFFYFRGGGGIITCGCSPFGISAHGRASGAVLPDNDALMTMGSINAYLPLDLITDAIAD